MIETKRSPMTANATVQFDPALKPDFAEARARWAAFWAGEIVDRPAAMIRCPKDGAQRGKSGPYMEGRDGDFDAAIARCEAWARTIHWAGEAVPVYVPSFGPDTFAGFLGARLNYGTHGDTGTSWSEPFVEDWAAALPLAVRPDNPVWVRMQEFLARLAAAAGGRWVVAHLDMHSNLDALAAIRGPERLCMDLLDQPELLDRAVGQIKPLYRLVDRRLRELGRMDRTGSSGWIPMYAEGRFNVTQCDFSCMLGPEQFRRFVLPALEDELAALDHSIYHLDGPDALRHLDDLLALDRLDAIQWVPGAGQPPHKEWLELLKRIVDAGKSVIVYCAPSEVPLFHRTLGPRRVIYDLWTKDEARGVLEWLKSNT